MSKHFVHVDFPLLETDQSLQNPNTFFFFLVDLLGLEIEQASNVRAIPPLPPSFDSQNPNISIFGGPLKLRKRESFEYFWPANLEWSILSSRHPLTDS